MGSKGKKRFKMPAGGVQGGGPSANQLEELQKQVMEAQQSLGEQVVSASVGGGAVTIEMTGTQEVRSVKIKPEVVDPEEVEMLQDLIVAAFGEAQKKVQELTASLLGPLAGGDLPPGLF